LVVAELCSLTQRWSDERVSLVARTLFADGDADTILTDEGKGLPDRCHRRSSVSEHIRGHALANGVRRAGYAVFAVRYRYRSRPVRWCHPALPHPPWSGRLRGRSLTLSSGRREGLDCARAGFAGTGGRPVWSGRVRQHARADDPGGARSRRSRAPQVRGGLERAGPTLHRRACGRRPVTFASALERRAAQRMVELTW